MFLVANRGKARLRAVFGTTLALLLLLWQVTAPAAPAQGPAPSVVPPGSGGVTFDAVRVISGNNLPRNTGQEKQPPVWFTIDAKGASAVVTVGNATRVALDFTGTIVLTLAPEVQPGQVLVSTGSTVVQGRQIVWSGFSLNSGEILPSVVSFASASGSSTAPAIQEVAIEARDPQSGTLVSERVAGGGPTVAVVGNAPRSLDTVAKAATAAAATPSSPASTVTPLSRDAARTFAAWSLALLGFILLLLLGVASQSIRLGREVRGLHTVAGGAGGLVAVGGQFAAAADQSQSPASAAGNAAVGAINPVYPAMPQDEPRAPMPGMPVGRPPLPASAVRSTGSANLEVRDGAERGRVWQIEEVELTIGRNERNAIVLADPRVSDIHARLTRQPDGRYLFVDQRSTNGSLLNGRLVREASLLDDGDVLRIGGTTFVFHARSLDAV